MFVLDLVPVVVLPNLNHPRIVHVPRIDTYQYLVLIHVVSLIGHVVDLLRNIVLMLQLCSVVYER